MKELLSNLPEEAFRHLNRSRNSPVFDFVVCERIKSNHFRTGTPYRDNKTLVKYLLTVSTDELDQIQKPMVFTKSQFEEFGEGVHSSFYDQDLQDWEIRETTPPTSALLNRAVTDFSHPLHSVVTDLLIKFIQDKEEGVRPVSPWAQSWASINRQARLIAEYAGEITRESVDFWVSRASCNLRLLSVRRLERKIAQLNQYLTE